MNIILWILLPGIMLAKRSIENDSSLYGNDLYDSQGKFYIYFLGFCVQIIYFLMIFTACSGVAALGLL